MLNTVIYPSQQPTDNPPLLIVHGLFGSARNWGVMARRLSDVRTVLAVDMRNHGSSFWSDAHSYEAMADDLAKVIAAHGGQADVVGHSMGGKAAMVLALAHGATTRRLLVGDIAPVAYQHDQSPNIKAMKSLNLSAIRNRAEADAALAQSLADESLRAFLLQSLDFKTTPISWRINLEALEASMPGIVGWPDISGQFEGPVLLLSGGASHYVQTESRLKIRAYFPKARFAKIPNVGHWLHAENPRAFEETLRLFLGSAQD